MVSDLADMRRARIPGFTLALTMSLIGLVGGVATTVPASAEVANPPGGTLSSRNTTPFPSSRYILGAQWTSSRYASPSNQTGDILATAWSVNGGTYMMMDDGGVDVPVSGGLWRQSLAQVSGSPPQLRFQHIGPLSPTPRTWAQIGTNPDNDHGPLGPYYTSGFTEVRGVFYATQENDWDWLDNGLFTGLAGIAYSRDRGETWHSAGRPFLAPLGNLTFIDSGARGGSYPDGYVYAIGTPREFDASSLILGRVRPGVENITNPARWQWFAGARTDSHGRRVVRWSSTLGSARPVFRWASHITYPEMTYDMPLRRYLLTFTFSYSSQPPAVWTDGAELVILAAPTPSGPFSFVAQSTDFGPSNGYDAGFPSQWISRDGRELWLKWAANFDGCAKGLDCSGKYGFNVAELHLTTSAAPAQLSRSTTHLKALAMLSASVPLIIVFATGRRRRLKTRRATRRRARRESSPRPAAHDGRRVAHSSARAAPARASRVPD
jgi:hypothetical protein